MSEQTDLHTGQQHAASATGLTKIYGAGPTVVRALAGWTCGIPRKGSRRSWGPRGRASPPCCTALPASISPPTASVVSGNVELTTLTEASLYAAAARPALVICQAFNLIPTLTAAENIELPLRLAGASIDREWLDTLIDTVGLGDRLDHRRAQLSGGQQQRVAAARKFGDPPEDRVREAARGMR